MAKRAPKSLKSQGLTEAQERFLAEYVSAGTVAEAARRVGVSDSMARRWMRHPVIATAVRLAEASGVAVTKIQEVASEQQILDEYASIAFSDISRLVGEDGRILPVKQWPPGLSRAVSSLTVKDGGEWTQTTVKFWDKLGALEKLGNRLQLWRQVHEVTGPGGGPVQVQAVPMPETIRERLDALLATLNDQSGPDRGVQGDPE